MHRFFSKMRYKLAAENRVAKYIRYAIGEILLVVIGILIAVQINSWNQQRKRLKLEKVLLEQVKDQILDMYGDISSDYSKLRTGHYSQIKIMNYIDQNMSYADSMCFDFYWIKSDEYIYPVDAAYGRIKEQGLDIITNDTIRDMVYNLYEGLFPRLSRNNSFYPDISEYLNDYYLANFKPNNDYTLQYTYTVPSDTVGGNIYPEREQTYPVFGSDNRKATIGYVPLDFEALKNDSRFLMLLDQILVYRRYKLQRYLWARRNIKEITDLIDKELTQ